MRRRHYLRATAGLALVAGCLRLEEQGSDTQGGGSEGRNAEGEAESDNVVTASKTGDDGDDAWPMQRFDPQNTAYNPDGNAPQSVPGVIGSLDRDGGPIAEGLLVGGSIYFPNGGDESGTVSAIDTEVGEGLWDTDGIEEFLLPEIYVDAGVLAARGSDGTVYGIVRSDGAVSLEFPFGGPGIGLTSVGEDVIAPAFDGWVRSVFPPDREVRWETPVGGAAMPVAAQDGTVFVSVVRDEETDPDVVDLEEPDWMDAGGFLNVLNVEDGEVIGQRSRDTFAIAPPAIRDGLLYWAGFDGEVIAIDTQTTDEAWRFEADGGIYRSPVLADGTTVVGTEAGTVYGIDVDSGYEEWSISVDGRVRGGPIGLSDTVLAGTDGGSLYALDIASGEQLWRFEAETPIRSLTAGDRQVYVGTQSAIYTLGDE